MKFSHGANLTAGSSNTILTAPAGYDAIVSYLFISNTTGSTKSIDAVWNHSGTDIDFLAAKSLSSKEILTFGGPTGAFLVMKEGDTLSLTPEAASTFVTIVSFEFVPATPRLNF